MARKHGKILCAIWHNPEFRALTITEQWAFEMLLSQPRISLVGIIDYYPGRWALLAAGTTESDVERAIKGLEAAGFVCVDRDTQELLVRTFTRHDGIPISNPKLRKGLWGAWEAIASEALRKVAVDNMPDDFFEFARPPEADRMRRSARMQWTPDWAIESSCHLPPTSYHRPPSTVAQPHARPDLDPPPPQRIPDEHRDLAKDAIAHIRDEHPHLARSTSTDDHEPSPQNVTNPDDDHDEHQEPDPT